MDHKVNEKFKSKWQDWNDDIININQDLTKSFRFQFITSAFSIGKSFYHIINLLTGEIEYCSNDIRDVLGYNPSEFNIDFYASILSPDDHLAILEIQNEALHFSQKLTEDKFHYKYCFDLRLRKSDGTYLQFHYQNFLIYQDIETNKATKILTHLTDISEYRFGGKPKLIPVKLDFNIDKILRIDQFDILNISKREKDVFELLVEGLTSKEIANKLGVSKLTIDTHRKNLLKKNNCHNTNELIQRYYEVYEIKKASL